MRGRVDAQSSLFAYVDLESKVPPTHPLRRIRNICDTALRRMDTALTAIYESTGRPSVPPEQLLKGCILQIMYGVRSERQLCEQIEYNMLYRWFLGMGLDESAWDHSVYTRNRDRLLNREIARRFLVEVVSQARKRGFVSKDHFSVDGTLLQAWASTKSLEPINTPEDPPDAGSGSVSQESRPVGRDELKDFRGQTFGNQTHRSVTDPDARLARKGDKVGAKMSYLANALMENRSGLVVDGEVRLASGDGGETAAAESMLSRKGVTHRITLGADKGYDTKGFIESLDRMNVCPHVARNSNAYRSSSVPDRVVRTAGYSQSIRVRKRIEEVFGWIKQSAGLRQVKVRGKRAVEALTLMAFAAYNLVRINRLMAEPRTV